MPDAHAALAQLEAMPCPKGVSARTWADLTGALRNALRGKAVSALALEPPRGEDAAPVLVYSASGALLSWGYYSPGDYDQNGEVGLSDLVPLAVHFGESTGTGNPFPENTVQAVVDGDGNGEINLGDIIAIAANFGVHAEGYRVYSADNTAACPTSADSPNGAGTVYIGGVAFGDAQEPPGGGRKAFNYQVVPTDTAQYYWVRPFEGDVDGAASNYVLVQLPPKRAPIAQLNNPATAETLAHIVWNAQTSFDPDGVIKRYEWDFNDDGVFEYDSGATPTAGFYYYAPGDFTCKVRVTDDDDYTDTESGTVTVTEKAKWHVNVVDEFERTGVGQETGSLALLDAAGQPAIVYNRKVTVQDPLTKGYWGVHFDRANDAYGETWGDPVFLGGFTQAGPSEGFQGAAAIVEGNPAVAYAFASRNESEQALDSYLAYQRADDPAGATWPPMTVVDKVPYSESYGTPRSLVIIGGRPAIAELYGGGSGYYCIANDTVGGSWPAPTEIPNVLARMAAIAGRFAYARLLNGRDLLYNRSLDLTALDWAPPVLIDQLEDANSNYQLLDVGGRPACVYFDDMAYGLKCRRAGDEDGTVWDEMVVLDSAGDGQQIAAVVDGRPAVMYGDRIGKNIMFIAANDAEGSRWGHPIVVPIEYQTYALHWSLGWESPTPLADVAGLPACASMVTASNALGDPIWQLQYVAYY